MRIVVVACMLASVGYAQYAGSASGSTTAAAEINSKPAAQTGATAPGGSCTAGKDFYTNTATGDMYLCTATNTWTLKGATGPAGPTGATGSAGAAGTLGVDCKDATGSTTAYTCPSPSPAPGSISTGMLVVFVPQTTNTTTSPTLAINSLAAKTIKASAGSVIGVGALVGGSPYLIEYDGTQFVLAGGSSTGSGVSETCYTSNTAYGSIPAGTTVQEVIIKSGITGDFRPRHVMVNASTLFAASGGLTLTVSMGRTGANNAEWIPPFALLPNGSSAFWVDRPNPPLLGHSNSYNIVLAFTPTIANINTLTAGVLQAEICGIYTGN